MVRATLLGILLSATTLLASDGPQRSGAEKVRARKAYEALKAFSGTDGRPLPETTLIDVGLMDRVSPDDEPYLRPISEVLLVHMLPDKPAPIAVAAALSLDNLLQQNRPSRNDYPATRLYRAIEREWHIKVLANRDLRENAAVQNRILIRRGE